MNILLWILQILLALHTAMGAIWKFSNSAEQTMPTLATIPNELWIAMSIIELLCSLALIIPAFKKSLNNLIPIAAAFITAEMLIFCGLHLYFDSTELGPMIYWLVVATICSFIAYGRLSLHPLHTNKS